MKAFVVTHYGPDGLEEAEVPAPTVGPRDVLVDVRASSINPLDTMIRNGEFKQILTYQRPFILGHDVAGVVVRDIMQPSSDPVRTFVDHGGVGRPGASARPASP